MSEGTKLAAALLGAQRVVESAEKSSTNQYHKYKYASSETILEVARDALTANGLSFRLVSATFEVFPLALRFTADAEVLWNGVGVLHARYILQHESGEFCEVSCDVPVCPEKGRPLDKALFAARTESLGYALRDTLLIPREDAPSVSGREDRERTRPEPARDETPAVKPSTAPAAKLSDLLSAISKAADLAKMGDALTAGRVAAGSNQGWKDELEAAYVDRIVATLENGGKAHTLAAIEAIREHVARAAPVGEAKRRWTEARDAAKAKAAAVEAH